MKTLQTDYGLIIIGDEALGKGGRGSVFPIEYATDALEDIDGSDLVFKLVEPRHRTPGRKRKVDLLARMRKPSGTGIAWPLASVYEEGEWMGYVMRKAEGCSLDEVKSDESIGFARKVQIASSMCALVNDMHKLGIVIGDVSLANFLYHAGTGALTLIDLDSAQVADAEEDVVYPTTESRAKSPEMLNGRLGETLLTSRSDDYLLAVEVFRLLFDAHPLDEYDANIPSTQIRLNNTMNRRFGFAHNVECCGVDSLGSEVSRLFHASFEGPYDEMPSARSYAKALQALAHESFETCPGCGTHRIVAHVAQSSHAGYETDDEPAYSLRNLLANGLPSIDRVMRNIPLSRFMAAGALAGVVIGCALVDPFGSTEALASNIGNLPAAAETALSTAVDSLEAECATLAQEAGAALQTWANDIEESFEVFLEESAAAAGNAIDTAKDAVGDAIGAAKDAAGDMLEDAKDAAGDMLKDAWAALGSILEQAKNEAARLLNEAGQHLHLMLSELFD